MHGIGMEIEIGFCARPHGKDKEKKWSLGIFLRGYTAMESLERIRLFGKIWKTRLENLRKSIYIYLSFLRGVHD